LFGFSEREVGHFTIKKWVLLYEQYKKHHNFKAKGCVFKENKKFACNDGWLPF
jgi:hypothetical protein